MSWRLDSTQMRTTLTQIPRALHNVLHTHTRSPATLSFTNGLLTYAHTWKTKHIGPKCCKDCDVYFNMPLSTSGRDLVWVNFANIILYIIIKFKDILLDSADIHWFWLFSNHNWTSDNMVTRSVGWSSTVLRTDHRSSFHTKQNKRET